MALGIGTKAFWKGPTLGVVGVGIPAYHGLFEWIEYNWDKYLGDDCGGK